jgi:hypothetical protein
MDKPLSHSALLSTLALLLVAGCETTSADSSAAAGSIVKAVASAKVQPIAPAPTASTAKPVAPATPGATPIGPGLSPGPKVAQPKEVDLGKTPGVAGASCGSACGVGCSGDPEERKRKQLAAQANLAGKLGTGSATTTPSTTAPSTVVPKPVAPAPVLPPKPGQ